MDAKEVKTVLKGIKESLDAKDYKSAVKQCKTILKSDRNNYFALVFFGAALQETDQRDEAPKAFKKAIEVSPDQILAWRGLSSFYEKFQNEKNDNELLEVYLKLLALETDLSKWNEIVKKFEKLAISSADSLWVKKLNLLLDELSNDEKKLQIQQCLVTVISSYQTVPDEILPIYHMLLKDLLSVTPLLDNHSDLSKKYLKSLYKQQKLHEILTEASKLSEVYPDELYHLEWICKSYAEIYLANLSNSQNIDDYSPKNAYLSLLKASPDSYLGYLCKGAYELKINDILNALDSLKQAVNLKPTVGPSWFLLSYCQILLYHFTDSEESSMKAIELLKKTDGNNENLLKCEIMLIQSLSEQDRDEKLYKSVKLGKSFRDKNPENVEVLGYVIKALIKLREYEEADKFLEILKQNNEHISTVKYLECFKYQDSSEEYKTKLEELVAENSDSFEVWLELGKIYYEENDSNACLSSLLKSTKLNQWCYWNFLYLGHCYRNLLRDLDKARRCYQKAFQLNPKNEEAGMCLSDIYRILQKEDLNIQLLSAAASKTSESKWAWLRLGLHFLSLNQYHDAVKSLRVAVRLDPHDKNCWESLGDGYLAQGAYTSALKSYQKVTELDTVSAYPLFQMATIKHLIGEYVDSVREFRAVLEKNSSFIPALKGHAEACISLMRRYLAQNLTGLAAESCQEAVNSLVKCLLKRNDIICIWKLLGDACIIISSLQEKYCKLNIPAWLSGDRKTSANDIILLRKPEILKLGSVCYCQALVISPNSSSLWYDLAISYNSQVKVAISFEEKKEMRELALSSVKKSIQLDNKSSTSWNLFGVICSSDEIKDLWHAQHAFINAIMENEDDAQSWTNLGTLYLERGDLQLANQSFTEAQKCDHDYVQAWIGQAIIAEITGHHDSMDLFRHSTQLSTHPEGSLGYSHLVCETLLNTKDKSDRNYVYSIENMNAVTVASDAILWYTDWITDDPCAFNMLGLLRERQKLRAGSAEAFAAALKLLEESKTADDDILDKVLLNYGRVLANLKRYDEALRCLKRIKKATFVSRCELAVTYFKAERYEEAYSSYETTLALDCGFKSDVLVAMAAVVYMHQGQEDAKILLMQAYQLKPASVEGLFACCALGMLHSDLSLSELSLKELLQYKDDPRYLNHIALFQAYTYLFKGKKSEAVRALCKVVHRHPNRPSLWLNLTLLILFLYPDFDSKNAAFCAEKTINSGRSKIDVSKVMSLVSLSHLLSGRGFLSLRSSQKAVHLFPEVTENWIVLIASVLSKCLICESAREILWLRKIITYVRRKLETSKKMTEWLRNYDRKVALLADKLVR